MEKIRNFICNSSQVFTKEHLTHKRSATTTAEYFQFEKNGYGFRKGKKIKSGNYCNLHLWHDRLQYRLKSESLLTVTFTKQLVASGKSLLLWSLPTERIHRIHTDWVSVSIREQLSTVCPVVDVRKWKVTSWQEEKRRNGRKENNMLTGKCV